MTPVEFYTDLERKLDALERALMILGNQVSGLTDAHAAGLAVEDAMPILEYVVSWEPRIALESRAYNALHGLAHAVVRAQDGGLSDPGTLDFELRQLQDDTAGLTNHLKRYFDKKGEFLKGHEVFSEVSRDVEEARDLLVLNYYGTALLVLGRAAEKVVEIIGKRFAVKAIKRGDRKTSWCDAGFAILLSGILHDSRLRLSGTYCSSSDPILATG